MQFEYYKNYLPSMYLKKCHVKKKSVLRASKAKKIAYYRLKCHHEIVIQQIPMLSQVICSIIL